MVFWNFKEPHNIGFYYLPTNNLIQGVGFLSRKVAKRAPEPTNYHR
jgi:hypothetical protein